MRGSFAIKSFQNGINLILNQDVDFEIQLQDIAAKFASSRAFFGSSDIALSIEGRVLSAQQEMDILEVIRMNSDLNVMCIVGKDDISQNNFIKALQTLQKKLPTGDYAQVYRGTVKNNDILEMDDSVIILGDVNPGSIVRSGKSIIVLGGLYGEAHAGLVNPENAFVLALEMEPEAISIGDFKYRLTRKGIWRIHQKIQPKIACLKDGQVVLESFTKDILEEI